MQPLRQLLDRIKWDREFGRGTFVLEYCDRVERQMVRVPLQSIETTPERPTSFTVLDHGQVVAHIPLHRVRAVYKDGVVIWERRGGR
jgi:uncharacterized protein (UPF0248 family)